MFGLFGKKKAEKKAMLGKASTQSIITMDAYLRSRNNHQEKLSIFVAPDLDNNVNLLCESIYLLGVFDCLILTLDSKMKYLSHKDAAGFLHAEIVSRPELLGYETWLRQALAKGDYLPGSYKIESEELKEIDKLFVAGHPSFTNFYSKEDGLVPEALGLDNSYEFYDFKEFTELKDKFESETHKG